MPEASLAKEERVMILCYVGIETAKIINPRIMTLPVKQIERNWRVMKLRDVERVSPFSLIVEEGEDVDSDIQLLLDCGNLARIDWVLNIVKTVLNEQPIVCSRTLWISVCFVVKRSEN